MTKIFYTSPASWKSTVDVAVAKRLPITSDRISEIITYDWNSYVGKAPEISDRWNREMT